MDLLSAGLIVALFFALWRLRRVSSQLRCARYAYLDMSDWAVDTIKEHRDMAIAMVGDDRTRLPDMFAKESEQEWQKKKVYHQDLFKRAGMSWLSKSEFGYALEDAAR